MVYRDKENHLNAPGQSHKCDGRNSETLRPISHKPVQQQ